MLGIERIVLISLCLLLFAGCAGVPQNRDVSEDVGYADAPGSDPTALQDQLMQQYTEWRGTPYRLGGLDKRGIDCSGFVYVTYRSRMGVQLPRTTELQVTVGSAVEQTELRTGDLVFFLIEQRTRHVGIYLDEGRFLHASKSQGVIISDLQNPYWQNSYWQAKRVAL